MLLPPDDRAGLPPQRKPSMMSETECTGEDTDNSYKLAASYRYQYSLGAPASPMLSESTLTPTPFYGTGLEDANEWLAYFVRYVTFKQLSEPATVALFALLMRSAANTWFSALDEDERNDFKALREKFANKYAPAPISLWKRASDFWAQEQRQGQSVEDFFHEMKRRAREVGATDDTTRFALMKGLRPSLRTYVMQRNPASCEEWLEAAKVAEATVVETSAATTSDLMEAIKRIEQRVACPLPAARRSPSPYRPEQQLFQGAPSARRRQVHFADQRAPDDYQRRQHGPSRSPALLRRGRVWRPPRQYDPQVTGCTVPCTRCARMHVGTDCIAMGKVCRACGKMNHFAICCRSRQQQE